MLLSGTAKECIEALAKDLLQIKNYDVSDFEVDNIHGKTSTVLIKDLFSNKTGRIHWDELKKLNPDEGLIDTLCKIYGRCSEGELHLGIGGVENLVDKVELLTMFSTLRKYAPKN